jgi:hypothetical protein
LVEGGFVVGDTAVGLDPERHRDLFVLVGERIERALRVVLEVEPVLVGERLVFDQFAEILHPVGVVVLGARPQPQEEPVVFALMGVEIEGELLPELVFRERVERHRDSRQLLEVRQDGFRHLGERVNVHPEGEFRPLELLPVDARLAGVFVDAGPPLLGAL